MNVVFCLHLGHCLRGTAERWRKAYSIRLSSSYSSALHQGWLWSRIQRICRELLSGRSHSNWVLFPRHGRSWGTYRYCRQNSRDWLVWSFQCRVHFDYWWYIFCDEVVFCHFVLSFIGTLLCNPFSSVSLCVLLRDVVVKYVIKMLGKRLWKYLNLNLLVCWKLICLIFKTWWCLNTVLVGTVYWMLTITSAALLCKLFNLISILEYVEGQTILEYERYGQIRE